MGSLFSKSTPHQFSPSVNYGGCYRCCWQICCVIRVLSLVVGTAVDTFLYYIVCQEVPVESEAGDDDSPPPSPGRQSVHSLSSFLPQPLFLYPILGYTDLVKLA